MEETKIGIVGTGFIASTLIEVLDKDARFTVSKILTRRPLESLKESKYWQCLTNSINELIETVDLVVECSGDVLHAAEVIDLAMKADLPIVTMNTEFHVTLGSYFVDKGFITEAEGDQPGSTAALYEDTLDMGFNPVVLGNMKGFLNHNPSFEDMVYWSKKNGISITQTTSFTDGTKIQFEQAFVANGLDGDIAKQGLCGLHAETYTDAALKLAEISQNFDKPIADYVLAPGEFAGVFIVAEHDKELQSALRYFKMGDGPYYILTRPFHLCSLEIPKTIQRVLDSKRVLLNNSSRPRVGMVAIAKHDLVEGSLIKTNIGGFELRGEAAPWSAHSDYVPIGLLKNARIVRKVSVGEMLTWSDVDIPESFGLEIASNLYNVR